MPRPPCSQTGARAARRDAVRAVAVAGTAAAVLCAASARARPAAAGAPLNWPPPRFVRAIGAATPTRPTAGRDAPPAALYRVAMDRPEVALTFDDGPLPGSTDPILRQLAAHHAHATFFVIGTEAERHPDLVRREARQGEDIENHGLTHVDMNGLGPAGLARMIGGGADTIERLTGRRPTLMRPPFGNYSPAARRVAADLGQRLVLWSIDTRDWSNPGVGFILGRVAAHLGPGDIVLMHDGGSPRRQTVEALSGMWRILAERHLRAVTVPKLLADAAAARRPTPSESPPPGSPTPRRAR